MTRGYPCPCGKVDPVLSSSAGAPCGAALMLAQSARKAFVASLQHIIFFQLGWTLSEEQCYTESTLEARI